jgi:sensor histidine kinase YesM
MSLNNKKNKNHSIFAETRKYLFNFFFIPFCILLIIFSITFFNNAREKQVSDSESQFEQTVSNIGDVVSYSQKVLSSISQDNTLLQVLENSYDDDIDMYGAELMADTHLYNYNKDENDEMSLYVIGKNNIVLSSNNENLNIKNYTDERWYLNTISGKDSDIEFYKGSLFTNNRHDVFALLSLPMLSFEDGSSLGVCVSEINISRILEDEVLFDFTYFSVLDSDGIFYIFNDDVQNTYSFTEQANKIRYWEDKYHQRVPVLEHIGSFITVTMEESHSSVVFLAGVDARQYMSLLVLFLFLLPAIIFLVTLVARYFAKRISNQITEPVAILCSQIDKVSEGDLSVSFTFKNNPELARAADHFSSMVVNIKELIDQVLKEQNEKRQYELMLLQSQINPHFLYNTLDSIIWLERMDCKEDSIDMLNALTLFLRTGLNKGKDIISLENEIHNVESYLKIQSHRYRNVFSYEIDVPPEMNDILVPKLILQPLVENGIYHGVKNCSEKGFLHVYAYSNEKEDVIVVADTGIGMDESTRSSLLYDGDEEKEISDSTSYGLYNVQKRLKLYYNDSVSFDIESAPFKGTQVIIKLAHRPNTKTMRDTASIEKLKEIESNE